jgi:hypothetical protein
MQFWPHTGFRLAACFDLRVVLACFHGQSEAEKCKHGLLTLGDSVG